MCRNIVLKLYTYTYASLIYTHAYYNNLVDARSHHIRSPSSKANIKSQKLASFIADEHGASNIEHGVCMSYKHPKIYKRSHWKKTWDGRKEEIFVGFSSKLMRSSQLSEFFFFFVKKNSFHYKKANGLAYCTWKTSFGPDSFLNESFTSSEVINGIFDPQKFVHFCEIKVFNSCEGHTEFTHFVYIFDTRRVRSLCIGCGFELFEEENFTLEFLAVAITIEVFN